MNKDKRKNDNMMRSPRVRQILDERPGPMLRHGTVIIALLLALGAVLLYPCIR